MQGKIRWTHGRGHNKKGVKQRFLKDDFDIVSESSFLVAPNRNYKFPSSTGGFESH